MNERIRELLKQAGYTPLPGFDFANELQEVFLEKFAELIINQCADVADKNSPMSYPDHGIKIKRYFGVKW